MNPHVVHNLEVAQEITSSDHLAYGTAAWQQRMERAASDRRLHCVSCGSIFVTCLNLAYFHHDLKRVECWKCQDAAKQPIN